MRLRSLLPHIQVHRPGRDGLTVLCAVLLAVQVAVMGAGGLEGVPQVFYLFGLSREGLADGRIWQLVTHVLLHGNLPHFLINWLIIFLVGGKIHHILGGRAFAVIFWAGVLLASLFHLAFHPARPIGLADELANAPLVGASGGAMALLIALTSLSPESRMWPIPVSGKNLGRGFLLAALLLFLITPGLGIPVAGAIGRWLVREGMGGLFGVAHIYHFGGGLFGLLYVRRLLRRPVTLEQLRRQRARREEAESGSLCPNRR